MDWQNYYVLGLALVAILLLALEKAHLSVIGVALMVAVAGPGLVTPEAAIGGFANPALVTIASLFIVGEGFLRTGAASILAEKVLHRTGRSESAVVLLVMVMAAFLSAFVNNTLVVVTFLPVITTICRETGIFPSRLLIPVSYASILGGLCTLVGTSTNLLVSGVLKDNGYESLQMFTITPAGIILAGVGILYLAVVGRRLLPKIPSLSTQMGGEAMKEYVMEVTVGAGSKLVGQPITSVGSKGQDGPKTMMLVRNEALVWPPFTDLTVREHDVLMLSGTIQDLTQLQMAEQKGSKEDRDSYDPSSMSFFELAVSPVSSWVGRSVGSVALKSQFGAAVVALQRSGRHIRERVSSLTLHAGDVLLAFGDDRSKAYLRQSDDFHLIEGVDQAIHRTERAPWAFAIILLVIVLFVTNAVHYSTAALIGALLMVVTGCLTVRHAQRAVRWPIIFFIAGMLGLSKALKETGTNGLIADLLQSITALVGGTEGSMMPLLIVLFLGTVLLTEFLTNNAVAVLMVPVALETAQHVGIDHRPLVMAVALGASCCFANPLGYQTNLMVLGPGGYRFRHFIKVGLPLDLLLAAVGVLVIPWFWPLEAPRPKTGWLDGEGAPIEALAEIEGGAKVALQLQLPQKSHVYVSTYSPRDGLRALFPTEYLRTDGPRQNPLPAGTFTLPGTWQEEPLSWPIEPELGALTFMVVASPRPLPDLDGQMARMRAVGNAVVGDASMGTYMPPAGTVPLGKGELPTGALRAAYDLAELPADGSMVPWPGADGVFVSTLKLQAK